MCMGIEGKDGMERSKHDLFFFFTFSLYWSASHGFPTFSQSKKEAQAFTVLLQFGVDALSGLLPSL